MLHILNVVGELHLKAIATLAKRTITIYLTNYPTIGICEQAHKESIITWKVMEVHVPWNFSKCDLDLAQTSKAYGHDVFTRRRVKYHEDALS